MKKRIALTALLMLLVAAIAPLAIHALATPGDQTDPLVTRSYVNLRIAELGAEISMLQHQLATMPVGGGTAPGTVNQDQLFAEIMLYFENMYGEMLRRAAANVQGPGGATALWTVLQAQPGQRIVFDAGADFIVRTGAATVVAPVVDVGIPDVTAGRDVTNGQAVGLNHLMLVPQTDGRGVLFSQPSWIMIRGGHVVQ
jgi:hypothetical protein